MTLTRTVARLSLACVLLGSLVACTAAPVYPVANRAPPIYVDTYPAYRSPYPGGYYQYDRHYDDRAGRHYRDERRERRPRRMESPLESPAEVHRDIRRSLGLPRLPGMP